MAGNDAFPKFGRYNFPLMMSFRRDALCAITVTNFVSIESYNTERTVPRLAKKTFTLVSEKALARLALICSRVLNDKYGGRRIAQSYDAF